MVASLGRAVFVLRTQLFYGFDAGDAIQLLHERRKMIGVDDFDRENEGGDRVYRFTVTIQDIGTGRGNQLRKVAEQVSPVAGSDFESNGDRMALIAGPEQRQNPFWRTVKIYDIATDGLMNRHPPPPSDKSHNIVAR